MLEQEYLKIFSDNLKRLMEQHDINNVELSKILGVSESAVGKWLLEKSIPRMGVIEKIARYFKVNKSDILEKTDDIPTYYHDPETAALAEELHNNPRLRVLMSSSRKTKPEDLEALIKIVERMTEDD